MKTNRFPLFVIFLLFTQLTLAQVSNPSIFVTPLDPDVPGGVGDQVRDLVLNVLHGGGGVFDTASIKYKGNAAAFGKFWRGGLAGIGVDSGLILSTGKIDQATGNNQTGAATHKFNNYEGPPSGDSSIWRLYRDIYKNMDIFNIPFDTLGDAAVLEFWYTPYSNLIQLTYIFASEEYPSPKFGPDKPDVDLTGFAGPSDQMFDMMGIFITNRPDTDTTNLAQIYPPDPPPPGDPPPWVSGYEIN
ncbi:MAG: choice-of-anchor L domain-containing protein, partial [Bacteroidales bacterium]|nr:choice-of-anchor L domain-containing protein [Bacteroidales bacterium]